MRDETVAEGIARLLEGILHQIEAVLAEAQQQARRLYERERARELEERRSEPWAQERLNAGAVPRMGRRGFDKE
jgi:hypothetical protein